MMAPASLLQQDRLARESIRVILAGQADSGAYVASPTFSQYGFAWFRDGSFCAHAMAAAGQVESAARFHRWARGTVLAHAGLFALAADAFHAQRAPEAAFCPPTRFNLNGSIEDGHDSAWPNYQLDGYGTWLSVLEAFGDWRDDDTLSAVRLVADLLAAGWQHPCYDCWEEAGDEVHASTLLAVGGGLAAAARMLSEARYESEYMKVRHVLERDFVVNGVIHKRRGDHRVDASLAWAALPHGFYPVDHPLVRNTLDRITGDLGGPGRGIRRYLGDSYFGGGDWVLLAGLIGWQAAVLGDRQRWQDLLDWVRGTADEHFQLPEQTLHAVQFPDFVATWEERWGAAANPLLWSHAMYLLMLKEGADRAWI